MAIRITGMYSGLDTEAIISELVSAQSVKKSKYVKDQTKLSWKMDAWKALNTKIYNFYTNTLDNMRFQGSFMKKATKVSNSSAFSVIAGKNAVDGVQNVKVWDLAKGGKLTGRDLSEGEGGVKATGATKLSELGIKDGASFDVTVNGQKTSIKLNGDMSVSDVVKKLQGAGLNASFDDTNHRFFISSKETGEAADFSIAASNQDGLAALEALGLLTKEDLTKKDGEYALWASYKTDTAAYDKVIKAEVEKRAAAYKKANEDLLAKNKALTEEIDALKKDPGYAKDDEGNGIASSKLYDDLYGEEGEDGKRTGGLKKELDDAKAELAAAQEELDKAETEDDIKAAQEKVNTAKEKADGLQAKFNTVNGQYSINKAVEDLQAQKEQNGAKMVENAAFFTESEPDEKGKTTITGTDALTAQVKEEFDKKVDLAVDIVNGNYEATKFGSRVEGHDAKIEVDGAMFTSSTNDFNINGSTFTVYEKTDDYVTVTTTDDVDGIYDMIKNFFTEYNKLINEMDALYNADSSKGYDPLTSEEKADMAESEIEEWEKKIKDSLLRRDGTLGDLTDAVKSVMLQGATVNGKTMYLSDFGINTLGFYNAGDNEKGAYHIYGDADDSNVSGEEDILKTMIASDPDTVMNFFNGLANNLYNKLSDKMSAVKDTSSAFTVYNDKAMQKEYDKYKDKITKEEEKLNALMDKWYEKFSRMETAMAKLQSKSNGLGNMLGGQ